MMRTSWWRWLAVVAVAVWAAGAQAYSDFGADGTEDNCQQCHKIFGGGVGDAEHDAHRSGVTGCTPCHGGFPAELSSPTFPSATGCVGCHGRDQDAGGDSISDGFGRGLRQHHANAGLAVCAGCHDDTDAMALPAVAENVPPALYATYTFLDPCNGSEERFASFTVSLDNDGDLSYDSADPDCPSTTTTIAVTTTSTTVPVTTTSTSVPVSTTSTTLLVTTTSTSVPVTTTSTTLGGGLVPGGPTDKSSSDCYLELLVTGVQNQPPQVEDGKKISCTDGEACDLGPCGDDLCTMRAGVCINQTDPNLPDCTAPTGLDKAKIKNKINIQVPQLLQGPTCGASVNFEIAAKFNKKGKYLAKKSKQSVKGKAVAPKDTSPRSDSDKWTIQCLPRNDACPGSPSAAFLK